MKKLILWGFVLSALLATAQTFTPTAPNPVTIAFSTSGTGAQFGPVIDIHNGYTSHGLSWEPLTTTTVTGCTVQVDSSPDGVTWTAGGIVASQACTTAGIATAVTAKAAAWARINVTAITAGQIAVSYTAINPLAP
jgi:hypothetical protein